MEVTKWDWGDLLYRIEWENATLLVIDNAYGAL